MITENLSTLKIHKLTQEQYDRELAAGNIDESALYLTPDGISDAVLYTEQSLSNDQKTQARENIGAVSLDDIVDSFSISNTNLLDNKTWLSGFFYASGYISTDSGEISYYGDTKYEQEYVAVTPGKQYSFDYMMPVNGTIAGVHKASLEIAQYTSDKVFSSRHSTYFTEFTSDETYSYAKYIYTVPDNVYYIRVSTSTFGMNTSDVIKMTIAGASDYGQRLLPEITLEDNGKVLMVVNGSWQVDDMVGNIAEALDTIIALQESFIGGGN